MIIIVYILTNLITLTFVFMKTYLTKISHHRHRTKTINSYLYNVVELLY